MKNLSTKLLIDLFEEGKTEEDYEKLTAEQAAQILKEVTYSNEEIKAACKNL